MCCVLYNDCANTHTHIGECRLRFGRSNVCVWSVADKENIHILQRDIGFCIIAVHFGYNRGTNKTKLFMCLQQAYAMGAPRLNLYPNLRTPSRIPKTNRFLRLFTFIHYNTNVWDSYNSNRKIYLWMTRSLTSIMHWYRNMVSAHHWWNSPNAKDIRMYVVLGRNLFIIYM